MDSRFGEVPGIEDKARHRRWGKRDIMAAPKNDSPPDKGQFRALARGLVAEQSTMTLASSQGGKAWAAPVYYIFRKSAFYFFSDPSSRHIQESMESGQAASAIYEDSNTWQGIRGIQMSGKIEAVPAGWEAIETIRAYLKKFSFTKGFFKSGQAIDLDAFFKRFRVQLYRFTPDLLYYMDNRFRFGFRDEVQL